MKHVTTAALLLGLTRGEYATNSTCKYIPGDLGWPSSKTWARLNQTVEGRLIKTVPQASICHTEPYHDLDETGCEQLRENWDYAQTFELKPAEIINPAFQNQSCDPYTPLDRPCELGNYAVYSINVTGAPDIVAGLNFARDNNVRLVIKNTGHDYMGKSTGLGSLSLWTHNLKSTDVLPKYESDHYTGPAVKIGAGVIAGELYAAVADQGYRAVGGTCPSVGIAGGYTAGGGHSVLSGAYGLAADNVLEWELVTANGEHIIATPTNEHSDLYWAMSGGGGGVWGVVLSVTSKIYPDGKVTGGQLAFNATEGDPEGYWKAIESWFAFMPNYTDGLGGGNTCEYEIFYNQFNAISFTVPDKDSTALDELLAPYIKILEGLNITYTYSSHTSDTFYQHFDRDFGPLPYGPFPANTLFSNRLFPREVVEDTAKNLALVNTIRNYTEFQDGYWWLGCESLRVNSTSHPDNSLHPAWREVIGICTVEGYWNWTIPRSEMYDRKRHMVTEIIPSIEAVTPGSGSYLNEVDSWYLGDWKDNFYGINYPRLLDVKGKYDPGHLFYAYTGVGSDYYTTDGSGRLCKA
ncbi:uncharacterized protein F4822DRAFT_436138 [Hypoxylon trugodes]|uniref:uncharacterized protein n=1 Tax=Hypoxylon trugodes TaxID=326681 RepID=UPI00218DB09D|nr:uncharacterized protein F4822DRAFT_436138 [Hypoxylon trugodes]KAI1392109.1 hypothetical protein F4822DRAFT_436138 [Hypoxylon trugodes]